MNILQSLESFLFTRRIATPVLNSHVAINDSVLALANIIDKVVLHGECKRIAIMALHEVQQYAIVGATLDQAAKIVTQPQQEEENSKPFPQPISLTPTQQQSNTSASPTTEMIYDNNI